MSKNSETYGVDISKDVFDVYSDLNGHQQYANSVRGFKDFHKVLCSNDLVVMEATGYYHYQLALYLTEQHIDVSVVNPLSVKRFLQMKLSKVKTDKSDARAICAYGLSNDLDLYKPDSDTTIECLQLLGLIETLTKQRTAIKNKRHAEQVLNRSCKPVRHSLNRLVKGLDNEISLLEKALLERVNAQYQQQLTLLRSIPGIGPKTAVFLLVITDGFSKFDNASQLCSYAGITPVIRESGSSVRGRSRISKIGNGRLRNLLFLCAFNASKHNKACRQLYERLLGKGKSKKLALIAVTNKLLRQCYAIGTSRLPYDEAYVSVLS